jgi:hypothetical protein
MNASEMLRNHRLLLRSAFAAVHALAWIFVFEYFFIRNGDLGVSIARVALLYALSQTATCLLTPLTVRGLRHGMKREIILGVLAGAAAFVSLGALFDGFFGALYPLAVVLFAFLLGLYRALYWVPYEVENHEMQARRVYLTYEVFVALMPVFACYMLAYDGVRESWLLFAAGAVMILSLLPVAGVPDAYEKFPWGYRETFGHLFSRAHRRLFFAAVIDGIQGAALLLLWPLAVFLIIGWSYPLFGLIFSFTLLLIIVARGWMALAMRRMNIHDSLPVRVALVSSAWVGRLFVLNPISVVIADSYAHAGNPKISIDHPAFEQASDAGHYIDQYTTLREIGLTFGRIGLCLIVALATGILPLPLVFGTAFVIAGISAGLSVILSHAHRQSI